MIADAALREAVLEELAWEPSVPAANIGVTAHDGIVSLVGHVETLPEKHAALAAARRVKGVKALLAEIEVRLGVDDWRSDEAIAATARLKLSMNSSIPQDAVHTAISGGWATLTGEVEWRFQYDAAADDVSALFGVVGLTNDIRLAPHARTAILTSDITRALVRGGKDAVGIRVTAEAGAIRLTGAVHSFSDRHHVGRCAWAAPGVTAVENDLAIV